MSEYLTVTGLFFDILGAGWLVWGVMKGEKWWKELARDDEKRGIDTVIHVTLSRLRAGARNAIWYSFVSLMVIVIAAQDCPSGTMARTIISLSGPNSTQ